MKLRYLFSTILASALLLVGCTPESIDSFENIKLSKTYLSIPVEGGSTTVTVTATGDWSFVEKKGEWPKCMGKDKDGNEVEVDAWLTVDKMSGNAGETVVTFTAGKAESGREFELEIKAGNNTQFLRVRQGSLIAEMASCAEIIAGPDGKNYKAKGICTSIQNEQYGNWILADDTGEITIYGTVNADGEYDWPSFDIAVGDSVYVEGPKKTYNGTVELVDVTVAKVVKALLALPEETSQIEKTAQDHVFKVAYKGKGVFVEVGDKNAQNDTSNDWITYKSMDFKKGVPSKLEQNPADTAFVTVSVAAVPDDLQKPRNGYVTVKSYLSEKESTAAVYTIKQMGHTPDVTPINTLVQQDATDRKYVRVEGIVAALSAQGLVLADETGALTAYYGSSFAEENEYKIGNKVAIQGTVAINNFGIRVEPDYDELLDDETTVTYGDAVVYDGEKLNSTLQTLIDGGHGTDKSAYYGVQTEYATMSGELAVSKSGSNTYYNLKVEGADKDASIYYPDASLKLADYNGKKVVLMGYVFSVSCSKDVPTYVYMMATDVCEPLPLSESFNKGIGKFSVENVTVPEGKNVWYHSTYEGSGYMKGSSYISGARCNADTYLVSPVVDLSELSSAVLTFEHAIANLYEGTVTEHVFLYIREVNGDNKGSWQNLNIPVITPSKDYTYYNSGDISLSAYSGKKVQIGFRYVGTTACAPTWQIRNVKIK